MRLALALSLKKRVTATDTTPSAFSFTDQAQVALSAVTTSAAVTPTGYDTASAITITGGEYELNASGSWTTSAGTISPGDSVKVRHTSSASNLTATNTVLTIGGVSDTFTSTTRAWLPADYFPAVGAYYDASDISTLWKDSGRTTPVTASGDLVVVIDDKSGNGHHLVAPSGQEPVYRTNGGAGGTSPYLDFAGVDEAMISASFAAVSQPHYVGVAVKQDSVATAMSFCDGESSTNVIRISANTTPVYQLAASSGAPANSTLTATTNDSVLRALFNGASSNLWLDSTATGSLLSPGTHQATRFMLGNRSAGSNQYLDGRIYAAFVSFGNVPSDPNKANILTWLGSKQGRTL